MMPILGYYCKVCKKYYRKRYDTLKFHCSSENHYRNWKVCQYFNISLECALVMSSTYNSKEQHCIYFLSIAFSAVFVKIHLLLYNVIYF